MKQSMPISIASAVLGCLGCAGSGMQSRYLQRAAILVGEGYRPVSPAVEEMLVGGEKLNLDADLRVDHCYAFLAVEEGKSSAIRFQLARDGKIVAKNIEEKMPFALLEYCPHTDGVYRLTVSLDGGGKITVGAWSRGVSPGSLRQADAVVGDDILDERLAASGRAAAGNLCNSSRGKK